MVITPDDWKAHAQHLADSLLASGDVRSPQWHAALAAVPRHVLVPCAYEQDSSGTWTAFETAQALDRVYAPETLITALGLMDGHQVSVSSSTKPDLMVRMLEILDIHPGHRVLEIGSGSGYNAALLAHRLGDDRVFSVDIDEDIIELARRRLASIGYRPTLVAADGVRGLPEHAPYDRIIATCSVPAVPWSWAEQLAPNGTILVDLKLAISAGNLVHLRRHSDRLEGRFTKRRAAFMAIRHYHRPPAPPAPADRATGERHRTTQAPAQPWNDAPIAWLLAQLHLPRELTFGFQLDSDSRQPTATTLAAPDGSWARINITDHTLTEAGDTPLWASVEQAYHWWTSAGRPAWERFGLTVTAEGSHTLWLDKPDGKHQWPLPPSTYPQRRRRKPVARPQI